MEARAGPKDEYADLKVFAGDYGTELAGGLSAAAICGLVLLGGIMSYGVILGTIMVAPVSYLIYKMREGAPRLYNWMMDHQFATVVILTAVFTGLFGTTATGLIASAVFGTLKIIMLAAFNKYLPHVDIPEGTPTILESLKNMVLSIFPKKVPVQTRAVVVSAEVKRPKDEVDYV